MPKLQIHWQEVESSAFAAVAYEGDDLYIRFHHGAIYQYIGVPSDTVASLLAAESLGGYYNRHIKEQYPFNQL